MELEVEISHNQNNIMYEKTSDTYIGFDEEIGIFQYAVDNKHHCV
jgi:hypothetical protein